ncbi:enoyl-CoA hydratase/isomerase family protein [Mycobacterium palustre]|uniref:Enoyl-CoA hydratase n=1 Tax=Mycobacterium palustre TaxID=153971 RepID=A0A1X1ZIT5_9MYCO|nr:enoyl-CoA hydratase/isomerase family protein [Mycobacterium palustre]MCV7102753.1 enoyl-CoA hydratase/isomerase family protein [Mycobacterium palustre]ORW23248.1 enoyl-CoA hydratase [Mycobacterium palustre]
MTLVLRHVADGIGTITLNRPEQMNALTVALGGELERAILELGGDPGVNVVVIRGAGGNFCAGGDFNEVELLRANGPDALRPLFVSFRRACDAIARVEVPVVAAVQGVAAAGGFELMQASDIVLVSDDAKIADNHIRFGMIPGGGSTQRLSRLVGRQEALGLLLSGDRMSGADAVRRGLAYRSFPATEFEAAIHRFATDLASRNRQAVISIKRLVYTSLEASLPIGLADEIDCVVEHICGRAGQNGVTAFRQRGAD